MSVCEGCLASSQEELSPRRLSGESARNDEIVFRRNFSVMSS